MYVTRSIVPICCLLQVASAGDIAVFGRSSSTSGHYVLDDPVIYDNGLANGENGLSEGDFTFGLREIADDFALPGPENIITGYQFTGLFNTLGSPPVDTFTVDFYEDSGGFGPVLTPFESRTGTVVLQFPTGVTYFTRPEIYFELAFPNVTVVPGTTYWVSVYMNDAPENFFHLTADGGGSPIYVSYPDLGWPKWTPGIDVFGTDYDVTFRMTGIPEPASLALLGLGALTLLRRRGQRPRLQ